MLTVPFARKGRRVIDREFVRQALLSCIAVVAGQLFLRILEKNRVI